MPDQPSDHDLNRVLADVAGETVKERFTEDGSPFWIFYKDGEGIEIWEPMVDANQSMLAEQGLLKKGWGITVDMDPTLASAAKIYKLLPGKDYHTVFRGIDPDKLRAFALAVYAMKQGEK